MKALGAIAESLRQTPATFLLVAVFVLLPVGRGSELPVLLMAGLGLRLLPELLRDFGGSGPGDPGQRLAGLLFLAYWLPELGSAFDSIAPAKSWTEVAADLRFLPFLLYAERGLKAPGAARLALNLLAALLALWCLDALLQAAFGLSLGGGNQVDRLSGIFGDNNLKLGGVMAALSPLLLVPARVRFGWPGFVLAAVALLVVVLLAGARAAWFSYALVLGLLLWFAIPKRRLRLLALGSCAVLALGAGLLAQLHSERFAERIERSAAALSGDREALDHALSFRLPIWRAAMSMIAEHPLNGVGVRGFRYAYPHHSEAQDRFHETTAEGVEIGALHAHQIVLEVLSETGLFGLLCWLTGCTLAVLHLRRQAPDARQQAWPAGLVLLALLFPLNTHYAVYSSFLSVLLIASLALWLGLLAERAALSTGSAAVR